MRMSIARICADLGVAWNTASDAILAAGAELVDSADRFDGVTTVGVDEHVWRHTRNGDKYVTVIIDLTPTRTRTGPSRLLAVVEGRSKQAFKSWLEAQTKAFRDRVEIVAMDGFAGYKTAAVETIDAVTTVMDPYPCGGPGRGQARPLPSSASSRRRWGIGGVPVARSTASDASPGPKAGAVDRQAAAPAREGVRRRAACRVRGHLEPLPERD